MLRDHSLYRRSLGTSSRIALIAAGMFGALGMGSAQALPLYDQDGWYAAWDNTIKYSLAFRTEGVSAKNVDPANLVNGTTGDQRDDGDRNFRKGPISNRVDLLSEFDLNFERRIGLRASAAAWYDTVYNTKTDNNSDATYNQPGTVSNRSFTDTTKRLHGRNVELLDAFVWANGSIGDMPVNLRAGRYAQLWGESLYFGTNGIAGGMAPMDTIKALSVPGSQVKELIMPVAQVGAQVQLNSNFAVSGYYQLEWRRNRNAAVGSFFSPVDFVDYGGSCLMAMAIPDRTCIGPRLKDQEPDNSHGQYGFSVKYTPDNGEYSLGLYALRFNAKDPVVYTPLNAYFMPEYYLSFHQGTQLYGASLTTNLGDANIGAEVSVRRNQPLAYNPNIGLVLFPGQVGDGRKNRLYPTGDTFHAQVSAIYALPRTDLNLWDGGTITSELAYNSVMRAKQNQSLIDLRDPDRDRSAAAVQVGLMLDYYQVAPGLDISVGPNVRYGLFGNSSIDPGMTRGNGSVSMTANFTYQNVWRGGLSYTHFVGDLKKQPFMDRDFIAFNIQRTF